MVLKPLPTLHFLNPVFQAKESHLSSNFFLINGEAKLNHAMDASAEDIGVIQAEAGGEQGGVEEQQDEFLHCLVTRVCLCAIPQLLQERMRNTKMRSCRPSNLLANAIVNLLTCL